MKVTVASLMPTSAANKAGNPAMTPELLAAVMARYSRSNEGLESILDKVRHLDPDAAVDNIFQFLDYGHNSIMDLAPVPVFIDGVSIALITLIWNLCPIGAGQESSTRYLKFGMDGLSDPDILGIPQKAQSNWYSSMQSAYDTYEQALLFWTQYAQDFPESLSIPDSVRLAKDSASQKKYARMLRNYAFDRARVFLPVATKSSVALLLSGREWQRLVCVLASCPLKEAQVLSMALREQLSLVIPRMLRHTDADKSWQDWWRAEFTRTHGYCNRSIYSSGECPVTTELSTEESTPESDVLSGMSHHLNRYGPFGATITMLPVIWAWHGIAMAEIRDVNRHRSGTRLLTLAPLGFHGALDQCPQAKPGNGLKERLYQIGEDLSLMSRLRLEDGNEDYLYWSVLGTQHSFAHTTTLDKMIYEIELRTGVGAHYRYAQHEHDLAEKLYEKYPELRGLVLEGSAEPE